MSKNQNDKWLKNENLRSKQTQTKWTEKEKQKLIIEPWICTYILSISHMCCSLWIEEIENCLKTKNSSTAKSQRSAHFLLYLEPSKRNAYRINWSFFFPISSEQKKKERIDRNYFTDWNRLKHSERFTSANVAIVAGDSGGFLLRFFLRKARVFCFSFRSSFRVFFCSFHV